MDEAVYINATNKALTVSNECVKMTADGNRWLLCPVCKEQKTIRLLPSTQVKALPVYCKRCKKESIVNYSI